MRTSLLFGLIALALLLLAGPYLTGGLLAQRHAQWVGSGPQAGLPGLPAGWQVTRSSLQRGWFSSSLDLTLQPPEGACGATACPGINTQAQVHHGPLALTALPARQALWPALAVAVSRVDVQPLLGGMRPNPPLPPALVVTRIGFSGQAASHFRLPAASHVLQNGAEVEHAGISGHWQDAARRPLLLTTPVISLASRGGTRLRLNDAELRQSQSGTTLGAEQLVFSQADDPGLNLSRLDLDLRLEQAAEAANNPAGLINSSLHLTLQQLSQGERSIGPLEMQLAAERLAPEPLAQLQSRLGIIYGQQSLPPHLQTMALQGLLASQLPALTRSGPRLNLETLRVGQGEGAVSARLDLRLQPMPAENPSLLAFIQGIDLAAETEIPARVAEAAAAWRSAQLNQTLTASELLDRWRADGLLVATGNRYRSVLRLADARLTINGDESEAWRNWVAALEVRQRQLEQDKGLAGQRDWPRKQAPDPEQPNE